MAKNVVLKTYKDERFTELDNARIKFYKNQTVLNVLKTVALFIVLAGMIVGFVIISQFKDLQWLMWTILGASLVIFVGISLACNFAKKSSIKKYFDVYYNCINLYLLKDAGIEFNVKRNEVLDLPTLNRSHIWKDIVSCPSRNSVHYEVNGQKQYMIDCSAKYSLNKQLHAAFVGKMIIAENKYENDEGIIIYKKAANPELALPPTDIENLKLVDDKDDLLVYSNNVNYKDYLTKALRDKIKNIEFDKALVDITISIQKGLTFIALGLDDSLMVVPYKDQFDEKPIEILKPHIEECINIIKDIE